MPIGTPSSDRAEDAIRNASDADYMSAEQLEFFRLRLLEQRDELRSRLEQGLSDFVEAETGIDMNDRATHEEHAFVAAAMREREHRELQEIEAALARVATGDYGWCERTGEPIGIPRLLARPTARTRIRHTAAGRRAS